MLREIKSKNKKIHVVKIPNIGIGAAINDRLKHAAIKMKIEIKIYPKNLMIHTRKNLSFTIEENKTLGLLGPNGCERLLLLECF